MKGRALSNKVQFCAGIGMKQWRDRKRVGETERERFVTDLLSRLGSGAQTRTIIECEMVFVACKL